MSLIKTLDDVAKEVSCNVTSELNYGGCAVYAALVGRWLKLELPVTAAISDNWTEISLDEARLNIADTGNPRSWNMNGVTFGHVILDFVHKGKKYFYDANGVADQKQCDGFDPTYHLAVLDGRLSVEETIKLAESSYWNTRFDRREIPKIKQIVDHIMGKRYSQQPTIDFVPE